MKHTHSSENAIWRILLPIEAAIFALAVLLRGLSVLSFRLAYLPLLLLLFLALDSIVLAVRYDRKHGAEPAYRGKRSTALFLLAIAILASVPLFTNYLFNGHDIEFHLFRIEGVRDGLAAGQFPVRIHPNTLYGYGYANPAFYPELLLYFPALLRLSGFSVMAAYKAFLFALNLLTAFVSYYASARMFRSRKAGLVGAAFYTLSLYRLVNLYTRAAIGEASAMTFLPLAALGIYAILFNDTKAPAYRRAFLPLTVGMTGLFGTHLLSCEMALPLLLLFCLVFWRRTFTGKRLLSILTAAICTALLSLAFLIPMLDYMGFDAYRVFGYGTSNLAKEAINLAQLFPLLPNAVGESNASSLGAAGEMPLGVGLIGLFVLLLAPLSVAHAPLSADADARDRRRLFRFAYVAALLLLIMSTNLFPWNALYRMGGGVAKIAGLIQFPWRLHALSTLLLTFLACRCVLALPTLQNVPLRRTAAVVLALLLVVTSASYFDRLVQTGEARFVHSNADLDQTRSVGDAEYLPEGTSGTADYQVDTPTQIGPGLTVTDFVRGSASASFSVSNASSAAQSLDLPLICYLGYTATDGAGNALPMTKGDAARIRVSIPAGYTGTVSVRFAGRLLWRAAEAVSLLTLFALVFWYCLQRKRYPAPARLSYAAPLSLLE